MKNYWLENNKISLIDVITHQNQFQVIKYLLYSEAEKEGIQLFKDYERPIEMEDIIYNLVIHIIEEYKSDEEEVPVELLEAEKHCGCVDIATVKNYFEGMTNLEVLKALE